MRLESNIDIRILEGTSLEGIPFPAEDSDPVRLTNPEEFRDLLGAQKVAQRVLPCIDTRAAYWHYYLFGAPIGRGRLLTPGNRLFSILKKTEPSLAGIGRRGFGRYLHDGRSSKKRLLDNLSRSFDAYYGSAMGAFWGTASELPENYPGPPTSALCTAAREYIMAGDFDDFFDSPRTRLRHMFHSRLVSFRPGLANFLRHKGYDLVRAAGAAACSSKLDEQDRLLFFSWAVLQAFYKIADDGRAPMRDDEDELSVGERDADNDEYYRALAEAALRLLDVLKTPGSLNQKQANTIRNRLKTALKQKGHYQPPVMVWVLKSNGARRRVFASLRLRAYVRLLAATGGAEE